MLKTNSLRLHKLSSRLNIVTSFTSKYIWLITPHASKNISSMNMFSMCSQISLLAKCGIACIADKFISSMDRIFEFYRLLWRKLTCTDYNCTDSLCDLRYTFWLNLHITCVLKISSWFNLVSHVMQIIHFHHEQITLSAIMLRTTTADHRTTVCFQIFFLAQFCITCS